MLEPRRKLRGATVRTRAIDEERGGSATKGCYKCQPADETMLLKYIILQRIGANPSPGTININTFIGDFSSRGDDAADRAAASRPSTATISHRHESGHTC
jgi:hypothetical protein